MEVGSKKSIDVTISKIAELFYDEFHLTTPPFITLLNHKTQCFHYYGRKYYKGIIETSNLKSRVAQVIEEAKKTIQKDVDVLTWFKYESNEKTKEFLQSASPSNSNDNIDIFVDLLLNTPISRHYGVIGQTFHTRIPRFFCNYKQFERYSGAKEYVEDDPILAGKQKLFSDIINTLENLFWEGIEIQSAIMAPIPLYGQMAGICFVANPNLEEPLSAYDYLRFLQLAKELAITSIKDAKQYEFLSFVIRTLSGRSFDVGKSIFNNLPMILNITGACRRSDGVYERLFFDNVEGELLPRWISKECSPCNSFDNRKDLDTTNDICFDQKYHCLRHRTCLHVCRKEADFILYFDTDEAILRMYCEQIGLAIEDVFGLIGVEKKNVTLHRAYGHDTYRLFTARRKCSKEEFYDIVTQRNDLMLNLLGEKIKAKSDISVYSEAEILQLWEYCRKDQNRLKLKKEICQESIELAEPTMIKVSHSAKVYKPAINNIVLNLMKNTFEHGVKSCVSKVNIEINENRFCYAQEFLITDKEKKEKFRRLPQELADFLHGKNIDFGKNEKGLGHYIIQWICNRFGCGLSVHIHCLDRLWKVSAGMVQSQKVEGCSDFKMSYEVILPDSWE